VLVTNFHIKRTLYKIVAAVFQLFDVGLTHPVRERQKRSLQKTVDYIESAMPDALGFQSQKELMEYAIRLVTVEGIFTEFGVFTGGTMRFMAKKLPHKTFHGFDSFEGLPEAWGGFNLGKGAFSTQGKLPSVPKNVRLHKGFYDASLPVWKQSHSDKISFMHVDCDLYSSTVTIFETLKDRMQVGTLILFDEYFNYPNWEQHEFKAWKEFVEKYALRYEYIGYARQQACVKITQIG